MLWERESQRERESDPVREPEKKPERLSLTLYGSVWLSLSFSGPFSLSLWRLFPKIQYTRLKAKKFLAYKVVDPFNPPIPFIVHKKYNPFNQFVTWLNGWRKQGIYGAKFLCLILQIMLNIVFENKKLLG